MTRRPRPLVLNVNDDEANRYVLSRILRKADLEVVEASNAAEALEQARAHPELVILDVGLPDQSGLEVCRRIKEDSPLTAVLLISARFTRSENRVEGLEGGADGYLVQPVEEAELLATVRSLLRLKRAEEEATLAAAQWRATFDTIGEPVCLLAPDGTLSRANRAMGALLGKRPEALVGEPFAPLLSHRFPAISAEALARLGRLEARELYELRVGSRWFRISADPVGPGGVGAVRVLADVTDRKHLEDELRRRADDLAAMDRRKDEFLGMLAHELRNPLAALTPALELMDQQATAPDASGAYRELAIRQTRHLAQLVDDLLDVSRITRGKVQLRLERVDLAQVVARSLQAVESAAKEKGHALESRLPPGAQWLDGDPARLEQVVTHLLDNAIKYTPATGRITVEGGGVDRDGRPWAQLAVRDTGIGIDPDELGRIFDLFAQLDAGIDRSRGGLGVGLSLTQKLVQLHGGKVWAQSEGKGRGSTFVLELPLVERPATFAAPVPLEPQPPPPAAEAKPPGRRVLLVEDNEDAREALRDLIEVWGHRVEEAADGEEGLELALRTRPEIAFIDVGLPRVDGFELARRIRASPGGDSLYLVALTGYGGAEQKTQALSAGFDVHLVKPVGVERLTELIRLAPIRGVR